MTIRTTDTKRLFVDALQSDLDFGVEHLERGREILARLEEEARGVDGMASALKAAGQQLTKLISDLKDEREQVRRKLLGEGRKPIHQSTNLKLAEAVAEEREA